MPCPHPIHLKRSVPVVSHSTGELMWEHDVPCGKCYWCMRAKASHWRTRLILEELHSETPTLFVTLTYDDDHLPSIPVGHPEWCNVPALDSQALQKYLKRFRKAVAPTRVRFFAVGEYGGETCRPHYHILLFNYPRRQISQDYEEWISPIDRQWSFGAVDVRTVTTGIVSYLSGYHALRYASPEGWPKPFMRCSKGLGSPRLSEIDYIRATSRNGQPNMSAVGAPGGYHSPYVWNKLFPFAEIGAYAKSLEDKVLVIPDDFDFDTEGRRLLYDSISRKGKFDGTAKDSVHIDAPPRITSKLF